MAIGTFQTGTGLSQYVDGNVDDFRISNGNADYGGPFTPPAGPLGVDQYTVLYLPFDGIDGSTTMPDYSQGTSAHGTWLDDWENEYDVTQSTASNQPLGVPYALNGKWGSRYDGVNDFLEAANVGDWTLFSNGDDFTAYIVVEIDSTGTDGAMLSTNNGGTSTIGMTMRAVPNDGGQTDSGRFSQSKGVGGSGIFSYYLDNNEVFSDEYIYMMFRYELGATGDDATTEVNQVDSGSANSSNLPHSGSNPQQPLRIGSDAVNSTPFKGTIVEVIIYNEASSAAKKQEVYSYIEQEYGL
jgi:hypothetical protein